MQKETDAFVERLRRILFIALTDAGRPFVGTGLGKRFNLLGRLYGHAYWAVRPRSATTRGVKLTLNPKDVGSVSVDLLLKQNFEPFESDLFLATIDEQSIVVDVGANIGYYTVLASALGKALSVIAFEPDAENYHALLQNVRQNKCRGVECVRAAVTAEEGTIGLYRSESNMGDHRTYGTGGRRGVPVRAVALDASFPVSPSVVKLDIQGSEVGALRGMSASIRKVDRLALFSEYWPHGLVEAGSSGRELLRVLRDLELTVHVIDESTKTLRKVETADEVDAFLGVHGEVNLLCIKGSWPDLDPFVAISQPRATSVPSDRLP